MMNILLQLWPGNLVNQLKNLYNAIEANWKKAVGHPVNNKLVSEKNGLSGLVASWQRLSAGPTTCGTRVT